MKRLPHAFKFYFTNLNSSPCILIFDSLAGASRARVVATLRDYLSCEYQAKMGKENIFSKDTIKGACPKVPQQSNFTDCGLYVLQYVESFFKVKSSTFSFYNCFKFYLKETDDIFFLFQDPVVDYTLPIKTLKNWFEEIVVTRKREDIAILLTKMVKKTQGSKSVSLPIITFPTHEGRMRPQKAENQVEKASKIESEMKKKVSEAGEKKSNATATVAESSENSSSELSSKTGTSQVATSSNQSLSTTDGSIVVQKEAAVPTVSK